MGRQQLLIVEDDETIAYGIQVFMQKRNFMVTCAESVHKAKTILQTQPFDLILLDWNLPDGNGYELCAYMKKNSSTPVIFLTVRDDAKDVVRGLDMGADDYIIKPFQLSILFSRINAVLRRGRVVPTTNNPSCEGILLDKNKTQVFCDDKEVMLTASEYRLLLILLENKNKTLTRRILLESLWDMDGAFVNDNTLTVTMKRLREKLGNPSCIKTIRGIGYRAEDADE
ncbi:response regulator transcription factor [Paenibacillus wynnii]|uniref:response regulator transcription factor n=1 Tax=Paenibacillus wynnii TaxID=268407 RepID=UPI002793E053|nr:response regulator transcription factor [Paenibacillus wynnii]MDQ0192855.1 DNA-binding response OmpR family regulator [Paenibacillus wynnii]